MRNALWAGCRPFRNGRSLPRAVAVV